MSLGKNIREIREDKGITIDEMVRKTGIFRSVYISIENSIISPSSSLLKKIASVFKINEKDIIEFRKNRIDRIRNTINLKNLRDTPVEIDISKSKFVDIETPVNKIPISVKFEDVSVSKLISSRNRLLTTSEILQIGNNKTVGIPELQPSDIIVDSDGNLVNRKSPDKYISSMLINYTEPFEINGEMKTLFFSQLSTDIKVGDRVFIINGFYDSNSFIINRKYKRGNDGYKVLFADRCRIALDINYTNNKPYIEQNPDEFINIHFISDRLDLIQASRQLTTKGGELSMKFGDKGGNIIFVDKTYIEKSDGWGRFEEIDSPGFYFYNTNKWDDITDEFTSALEQFSESKIRISGGSFEWVINDKLTEFKEGFVYRWDIVNKTDGLVNQFNWLPDPLYKIPIITKSNFRFGDFKGTFNSGVFGSIDRVSNWNDAVWNNGLLFNTDWESGVMNSTAVESQTFVSDFSEGIPFERIGTIDNDGFGFNYIIDSNIRSGLINGGNFIGSEIGDKNKPPVVENKIKDIDTDYDVFLNNSRLNNSILYASDVKNSNIIGTKVFNSNLEDSKFINSQFISSVINSSTYLSTDDLKILAYDEYTIAENNEISGSSHKIYKFYISKEDWLKLKNKDIIYIKNIFIKDRSVYPISFFDRKFKISTWFEYFDSYRNGFEKVDTEVGVFLSTPLDNDWKINWVGTTSSYASVLTEENVNKGYSVDVVFSLNNSDNDTLSNFKIKEFPEKGLNINKRNEPSESGKSDGSFITGTGFNNIVNVIKLHDNKVIVGGKFTLYNGFTANKIVRLNSDGTIDESFITGVGFGSNIGIEVFDIKIDNNGKILVGGNFAGYNGVGSRCLVRLNQDGSIDKTFNLDFFRVSGAIPKVRSIEIDSDDRIIIGGYFNRYNQILFAQTISGGSLIRVFNNGEIDNSFNVGEGFSGISSQSGGEAVRDIKIQTNGKILVSGDFLSYNEDDTPPVIRLEENGVLDVTFGVTFSYTPGNAINTISIQNDGKILLGSNFKIDDSYLIKIDQSGQREVFTIVNNKVNKVKNYIDLIYVMGDFGSIVLKPNGSEDEININKFAQGSIINDLEVDDFDRIYIAGLFSTYDSNSHRNIVRVVSLFSEPTLLGNNIDIENAYIIRSDFDSGIVDNVKWLSGDHINYNNDINFTVDSNFGTYSIIALTQSSRLLIKTNYSFIASENININKDDIIFLNGVEFDSGDGNVIKLGDSYKVINTFNNESELLVEEIGTNILSTITQSGTFSTIGAQNRYNYLHRAKIQNTKISSGLFRRSYIDSSDILDENLNSNDKDFNDLLNLKNLIISDSIFKNNSNRLSKALYINSNFIEGNDNFLNGIVFNSIWNGLVFNNGLFKKSRWVNGDFKGGLFYNNRSFNLLPSLQNQFIGDEIELSYYKDGVATQSNDRYSWQDGKFNGGDFLESDWEDGEFSSGKFYYSNFHGGTISGGILGDLSISVNDTKILNANIDFTSVNNASLIASENYKGTQSSIIWKDGRFNSGIFGSEGDNTAIWENGIFNGGEFRSLAVWQNGIFNSGDFISTYGWTMSESNSITDYTWQNGEFNGGNFGNSSTSSNSTWYNGQFNGGKFKGRVWNDGVFVNGEFIGSATHSATGEVYATSSNALLFKNSFGDYYYGLWRDGFVTNKIDNLINKSITSKVNASIKDILWLSGTFSHSSGEFKNSVWLTGVFESGDFIESSFNPYVLRQGATPSFELSDSTIWINGSLKDSDFYISKWKNGLFDGGSSWGMKWENGVCNYMNAFNIFWDSGLWKNGNWHGSYMDYLGSMSSIETDFYKQVLKRGISFSATQSMHIWNLFDDGEYNESNNSLLLFDDIDISPVDTLTASYTASVMDEVVISKIGNGYFNSGVWENGVWNSGVRSDNTIDDFKTIKSYLYSPINRTWSIEIVKGLTHSFKVGDNISFGNIVAVDINDNRRLLKDSYKITKTTDISVTIEVATSFAIRRIEKDSDIHTIRLTKNSWLSGVFLNGIFEKGVWNFGLFKGFPKITKMIDTHWIDGSFDGGHFKSNLENIQSKTFSTGVIQNFRLNTSNNSTKTANDSSTASEIYSYNSWIDVNYKNSVATNIGRNQTKINTISNRSLSENNLYGTTTDDILSSVSKFRDSFSIEENEYKLGNKYKIFVDFIGESSQFSRAFSNNNTDSFVSQGWTFSGLGSYSISSNSETLEIKLDPNSHVVLDISNPFNLSDFDGIVRNRDTSRILQNRYSLIEFDIFTYSGSASVNFDNLNNDLNYLPIKDNINYTEGDTGKKIEFFYNKRNLSMNLTASTSSSIEIDNLKFYEVDMVPFFKYFDEDVINKNIQIPLIGKSPYLPYNEFSNIDFFFIDGGSIGVDSKIFFD